MRDNLEIFPFRLPAGWILNGIQNRKILFKINEMIWKFNLH